MHREGLVSGDRRTSSQTSLSVSYGLIPHSTSSCRPSRGSPSLTSPILVLTRGSGVHVRRQGRAKNGGVRALEGETRGGLCEALPASPSPWTLPPLVTCLLPHLGAWGGRDSLGNGKNDVISARREAQNTGDGKYLNTCTTRALCWPTPLMHPSFRPFPLISGPRHLFIRVQEAQKCPNAPENEM